MNREWQESFPATVMSSCSILRQLNKAESPECCIIALVIRIWMNILPEPEQWSWPKHLSLFTSPMLFLALIQHAGAFYFRRVKS